jgi:Holliday junction resolvasome RuvABC endonuclease subunit
MGIAVLVGDELVRVEVENIRDAGMSTDEVARQAQRILEQWIDRYRPDVLAVELPEFAQSKARRQLRQLVRAITITGRKAGLEVRPYVPTTVRRRMCSHDRPTRLAVAREVAERFAWLAPYYQKEAERSWWRKPYWLSMFDAIAVGLVCHEDHARRRRRTTA